MIEKEEYKFTAKDAHGNIFEYYFDVEGYNNSLKGTSQEYLMIKIKDEEIKTQED